MAEFTYLTNPAKVKEFLLKIKTLGVPDKITIKYLESIGFKSKNDRAVIPVLKSLQFVDSAGKPTERWQHFRGEKAGKVLAESILEHYNSLYDVYPNAHQRDNEALRNFFTSKTKLGAGAINYMVATFKTLVELADFKSTDTSTAEFDKSGIGLTGGINPPKSELQRKTIESFSNSKQSEYAVNINIQITFPSDVKPETFDAFFNAMKKYLKDS